LPFSIAINRSKKQDDQWIDEAHYFDIDSMEKAQKD